MGLSATPRRVIVEIALALPGRRGVAKIKNYATKMLH
jgi:hypothetical protein